MNRCIRIFSLTIALVILNIAYSFAYLNYYRQSLDSDLVGLFLKNDIDQKDLKLHYNNQEKESYPDFTKAADNAVNGVVHIKSIAKSTPSPKRQTINPFEFFFGFPDDKQSRQGLPESKKSEVVIGTGSGVIVSDDGYIITNNHVIDKATSIEVTLNDNRKYTASVIGVDPLTDIALLKITDEDKFSYVPFGDSDKLRVGEWVIAVGNPFNLTSTVTKGIVSAKARGNLGGDGKNAIQSFIQTDAAINQGNSGGALVNINGELVGINTAIYSQNGAFTGYGFAIPISIAGKVAQDLKEFGRVQRAILGIQIINLSDLREFDDMREKLKDVKINEGVYIDSFAKHSSAEKAGLQPGDIITAINQIRIPNSSILQEQVSRYRPGDTIYMTIDRDNKKQTFEIVLTNAEGGTSIPKKEDMVELAGVIFKDLSSEIKAATGLNYGIEVASVDKNGAFAKKGITKGSIILEINRVAVQNVKQAIDIINMKDDESSGTDNVLLIKLIMPNGQKRFEAIELK